MQRITIIAVFLFTLLIGNSTLAHVASHTYADVPETHNNYADVMYLLERGIISQSTTYGIHDIMTREDVAVLIAKALQLDGTQRATKFSDVPQSHPNSGYIQSAVEAGIINGYDDGTFNPTAKITRGHMAAFIARAFTLPNGTKTFSDVPPSHTAYEAVQQLAAADITTGYDDGSFKPAHNLSRAHISAFLTRSLIYQEKNELSNNITILYENEENADSAPAETSDTTKETYDIHLDRLTGKEKELAKLINEYRVSLGLQPFTISTSLTIVARTHVLDSITHNPASGTDARGVACNGHSWSNNGNWTAVCYTGDHQYAELMWNKPRELTNYKGDGFENSAWTSGEMTPAQALNMWKNSPGHNNVLIGDGPWSNLTTIGIGIHDGYSHIWFGMENDPAGTIE